MLHIAGEEFVLRNLFEGDIEKPASVSIGLYNQSLDTLTKSNVLADITTEPTGEGYARQEISFGTGWDTRNNLGSWESIMDDITFDTDSSTEIVDSWFLVIEFQRDADTTVKDHLFVTGNLGQSFDLSGIPNLTLNNAGVTLD